MKRSLIPMMLAASVLCHVSPAAAVPIVSQAGIEFTSTNPEVAADGTTVVITAHPLWQPAFGEASWISYAQTGYQEAVLAPPEGTDNNPTGQAVIFSIVLPFTVLSNSLLNLTVWADDTAEIFLDDVSQGAPNFEQDVCADGILGCEAGEGFELLNVLWTPGVHSIRMNFYQVGSELDTKHNPFGALFNGSLEALPVPEPASMVLLGTGLMGLAAAARRRRQPKP